MKISIITVVYNNCETIQNAIESVIDQSYQNIEYIIIDGGSNDGTLDIIYKYQDKITHLISEADNGIYDAMNKGINLATGDLIGILNSDDLYYNCHVIEDITNEFINDKYLDIIYGDLVYVNKYNTSKTIRKWYSCQYYNNYFEDGNVPPHPTLFIKRKIYSEAGIFNLNFHLAADYEFMLRIFKKYTYNSKYLNKTLVKMRLGGATNKNFKNIYLGNIEILKSWVSNDLKIPWLMIPKKLFKRLAQFL